MASKTTPLSSSQLIEDSSSTDDENYTTAFKVYEKSVKAWIDTNAEPLFTAQINSYLRNQKLSLEVELQTPSKKTKRSK